MYYIKIKIDYHIEISFQIILASSNTRMIRNRKKKILPFRRWIRKPNASLHHFSFAEHILDECYGIRKPIKAPPQIRFESSRFIKRKISPNIKFFSFERKNEMPEALSLPTTKKSQRKWSELFDQIFTTSIMTNKSKHILNI